MLHWFKQLSYRERLVIVIGSISLIIILGYALFLEPFMTAHTQLKNRVNAQKITLEWMQRAAVEVQQLRHQTSQSSPHLASQPSLLSIVDKSTRMGALAKVNKRIEPKGMQKLQVRFESVKFTELISWLGDLYNDHAVQVTKIHIKSGHQPDIVKVSLTLEME